MYFALSCLITAIIGLILGLFVYFKNRKQFTNKIWCLLSMSIFIWGFAYFMLLLSIDKGKALFWTRVLYSGATLIPVFFLDFVHSFLDLREKRKRLIKCVYLIGLVLLSFNLTPFFIKDIVPKLSFRYYPQPGVVYHFFLLTFSSCVVYSIYIMLTKYKEVSGYKRNQIRYILLASIIGFGGGATNYPLIYNIPIFPFGHYLVFLYPIIITYAIITTRLMDITAAVTKTAIFTTVYSIFLGIPPLLLVLHRPFLYRYFGTYWWLVPAGVAGCELLAFVAPTISHYFQERANRILLKKQRIYQQNLINLAKQMTLTKDLRSLLVLIIRDVTKEIGISHARIYLWDKRTNQYVREIRYGKERRKQVGDSLSKDAPLIQILSRSRDRGPILKEEVISHFQTSEREHLGEVETQLRSMGASLLLPAFIGEELTAFLVLGTKRSKEIYTPDDLDMFKILAGQAALAIENAQFYQELKESQATMIQAARLSSVGELAAGFAHQIDNPLAIVSMGAELCIRDIKEDFSQANLTEREKEILQTIRDRQEKMVETAHRAAKLIQRIRGYAKPSDRDFLPTDLNSVMEDALGLAQYQISRGGINVSKDIPQDLAKIKGIGVQLEQVFLNMIINACEAMAGKKGELTISASAGKDNPEKVEITIADNGCGISKENLDKLFDLFFTTKGSKGTGVGLSMAYRIIRDHNGEINVESEVEKGTKFTIFLPIWEENRERT
ncbi:MAG: ATP-binding protein [bacterium]